MSEVPTPPVVEPPVVTTPQTPEDYKALYEAEAIKTADLIKQRNFLKPAQRMLEGLDQEARDELIALGQLAAKGDREAMIEWTLSTAEGLSGKDIAELIAERQKIEEDPSTEKPAGLTPEQVEEMVEKRLTAQRNADKGEQAVTAEMAEHGYKLTSAAGRTILQYAVDQNVNVKEAVEWYEKDTATTTAERQKAAAAAAATVPGVAPNGTPVGVVSDRKEGESDESFRRRSIEARIKNAQAS